MVRRTITEEEIALIKAMLLRGMKNRSIQFFFNRPDRPVNSGRISTIRSGSYSNSADIEPATDEELDLFMESEKGASSAAAVAEEPKLTTIERAEQLFKRSEEEVSEPSHNRLSRWRWVE